MGGPQPAAPTPPDRATPHLIALGKLSRQLLRGTDELADDGVVVVRGGELEPEILRADALRHHSVYGTYGISVLAASGITVDELAQQPPLVRFEVLALVAVGVIRAAGLGLDPTGRNRHHYTVRFDDLVDGVEQLRRCEHVLWANPYHEE